MKKKKRGTSEKIKRKKGCEKREICTEFFNPYNLSVIYEVCRKLV